MTEIPLKFKITKIPLKHKKMIEIPLKHKKNYPKKKKKPSKPKNDQNTPKP